MIADFKKQKLDLKRNDDDKTLKTEIKTMLNSQKKNINS